VAKRAKSTETIVGFFVLGAIALLLIVVIVLGRQESIFQRRYEIIGAFDSVGGLQVGANVQLAGIVVGYVKDIRFGAQNRVEVVMDIAQAQQQRIRADSLATIRTMGLMGDRYVAITVGSQSQPAIPQNGAIRTSEPFGLPELLASMEPTFKNLELMIGNLAQLSNRMAAPNSRLTRILDNLDALTTAVREGRGTIGELFMSDALYRRTAALLDTADKAMQDLQAAAHSARTASAALPATMAEADLAIRRFTKFFQAAEAVAREAGTIISNLGVASNDIKAAAQHAEPLMESANETVNEARQLLEAAQQSWLFRGYFPSGPPPQPLTEDRRDEPLPETSP
jgi:phospholipid/cholesterol/gamma-HCH transport system substrate-binding protein